MGPYFIDQILFAYNLYCKNSQDIQNRLTFLTTQSITVMDSFVAIVIMTLTFGTCDD